MSNPVTSRLQQLKHLFKHKIWLLGLARAEIPLPDYDDALAKGQYYALEARLSW